MQLGAKPKSSRSPARSPITYDPEPTVIHPDGTRQYNYSVSYIDVDTGLTTDYAYRALMRANAIRLDGFDPLTVPLISCTRDTVTFAGLAAGTDGAEFAREFGLLRNAFLHAPSADAVGCDDEISVTTNEADMADREYERAHKIRTGTGDDAVAVTADTTSETGVGTGTSVETTVSEHGFYRRVLSRVPNSESDHSSRGRDDLIVAVTDSVTGLVSVTLRTAPTRARSLFHQAAVSFNVNTPTEEQWLAVKNHPDVVEYQNSWTATARSWLHPSSASNDDTTVGVAGAAEAKDFADAFPQALVLSTSHPKLLLPKASKTKSDGQKRPPRAVVT